MRKVAPDKTVVIVDGARTPMGGLMGCLSSLPATELGTVVIAATLERSKVPAEDVDEVFMGCVLPAGLKQGPARQAALGAGLPASTGCVTLNKICGSGMQAVVYGHDQIVAGTDKVVIAGGMESMSNAPHLMPGARGGLGTGHRQFYDHMFLDGLEDAYTGRAMGSFAQQTADQRGMTREQMDAFALESLNRAKNAIDQGLLQAETAAVTVPGRGGDTVITDDEQPHKAKIEKIPQLRAAFSKDGTITAANASSISDGASALLMMSTAGATRRGLQPMAKIVAHARHSQEPALFTTAPVYAINKVLEKAGWSIDDVDLFEINEAFAMVTMLAIEELELDHARVNVNGGACAQGHPIGSSGSRIIVSLMYALKQRGKQRGVAAICIGGGEALAIAIEML
jgi:acetyl-CoA C-acetyltransferase